MTYEQQIVPKKLKHSPRATKNKLSIKNRPLALAYSLFFFFYSFSLRQRHAILLAGISCSDSR